jgi:hypothetical protein
MEAIRTWSFSRLDSRNVWDWEPGELGENEWPAPGSNWATALYEDDGSRVLVRGIFLGGSPDQQVVPRRIYVVEDSLRVELEKVRSDAELIFDVEEFVPYEVSVEFNEQIDKPQVTELRQSSRSMGEGEIALDSELGRHLCPLLERAEDPLAIRGRTDGINQPIFYLMRLII